MCKLRRVTLSIFTTEIFNTHRGFYLSKAVVGQRLVERGGGGAVSVVDV